MLFLSTVEMKHNTDRDQKSNTTKCVTCKDPDDSFQLQAGDSNSPYQLSFISLEVSLEKLVVYQLDILWLMIFFSRVIQDLFDSVTILCREVRP